MLPFCDASGVASAVASPSSTSFIHYVTRRRVGAFSSADYTALPQMAALCENLCPAHNNSSEITWRAFPECTTARGRRSTRRRRRRQGRTRTRTQKEEEEKFFLFFFLVVVSLKGKLVDYPHLVICLPFSNVLLFFLFLCLVVLNFCTLGNLSPNYFLN